MSKPKWPRYSLLFAAMFISAPLAAQDADDEAEGAGTLEEVIITGSRIRQNPVDVRTPVQYISEEDVELTSSLAIGDYLQNLPIAGSSINRLNNSSGNLGFPPDGAGIGAGASEIDLRYLGSKRTLVLVDGRRWIRGSSASGVSGAVDLNTIPANAIKSIEILGDGASAVYGSDAIGGVVNIITDDNYDGFKASAYYGQFDEGDGESTNADIKWGAEGERSRTFVSLSWTEEKDVGAGDRKISAYPISGIANGASSGTPEGRFVFTDPISGVVSITPTTTFPDYTPGDPTGGGFKDFAFEDRFNWQPFNFLLTPSERVNIFVKSEFDITEHITARVMATYNNRESTSRAAPEPLFFGPDGGGGAFLENLVWPADHPFNPFGIDLGPDNLIFTGRRPIEAGPRVFDQNVDTYFISAGLDGWLEFGDQNIYWDATASWAENNATQVKHGAFNARNIATALGPNDICEATPGCVPFNFVGAGSMTQEMLDYVTFVQKDQSEQELFDFVFNVTGGLPGLSAGDIGWAVGFEHREEDGVFIPDSVVTKGETAGVPASPTAGGFDADEVYGEVIVPLWAGDNGERFDVNGAVRFSDYDLFDSETVFKVGANWAPMENLVFRASFSEGFRAPNIGELFNTGSRFDASVTDRCSNASGANIANCAALGVPADFVSLNPQTSVTTGGNENLTPETSDTINLGFTWQVPFADDWNGVDGLMFEVNYYDIDIDNAIQPPDAQDVLDQCIATQDPFFCDNVTRTANGTVTRIDGILQNIGGIETSGFDFTAELLLAPTGIGQFRIQWLNTFLNDYTEIIQGPDGFVEIDREGTELGSPERAFVEYKSNLNFDWTLNDWSARLGFRYIDGLDEDCGGLTADFEFFELCSNGADGNKIESTLWTDAQVTFAPDFGGQGRWAFTLGVDNLFDETVPFCSSCDLNSFDGTLYPIPGQFWYGRITYAIE